METSLLPFPKTILSFLDQSIMGQDDAKRKIAAAAYQHYMTHSAKTMGAIESTPRSNFLLFGPTGSGKTLIAKTLADFLKLPFIQVDLTHFVSTGYVGEPLGSIIQKILGASKNRWHAEKAILFFDEFDKIAGSQMREKDVTGFALQAELRKMMEGGVHSWRDRAGAEHVLNSSGVFFIFAGAFPSLPKIIERRIGAERIGFPCPSSSKKQEKRDFELLSQALPEDFDKLGFLPEIIGRMGDFAALQPLGERVMESILLYAKGSPLKAVQDFFRLHAIELEFSKNAIRTTARKALKLSTGARALSTILGNIIEDLRFQCPDLQEQGVRAILVEDIGKDGCPIFKVRKGKPAGIQKRQAFQAQVFSDCAPQRIEQKKTRKAREMHAPREGFLQGEVSSEKNDCAPENEGTQGKGQGIPKQRKGVNNEFHQKQNLMRFAAEKQRKRREMRKLICDQIEEEKKAGAPVEKLSKASTTKLLSWLMDIYDETGERFFTSFLERIRYRGRSLASLHQVLMNCEGKSVPTVLFFWDYWEALKEEKERGENL